ncbi:MAG TPA: hydroxyphenylacetyl-CoA thioesterase PaaI [Woeseiaceae bacterium]|nr:hydroxyphenylacetyl-CoA thioesterase PaaI [Woeseiaceae bacterium]
MSDEGKVAAMERLATARQSAATMLERDACTRALGIDIEIPEPGQALATMDVRDDMLNGFGVCHGGVVFVLADTAFAFACNAYNDETLSATAAIEWLQPVHAGERLTAHAREDERHGRHGFYTVRVCSREDVLVALFRGHSVSRGRPLFARDESDTK